ncbi:hypothetical protein NDU88_003855 [Pleurodeles waltl]|uniref:Uncharacterized protein n=1 Tax=Pleurodeles waltl TaxID=8319 RepID=A0AAV7RJP3_PLEWA|nr:hypothetical protein NDU88_003855 [Pleurodeles waltl]
MEGSDVRTYSIHKGPRDEKLWSSPQRYRETLGKVADLHATSELMETKGTEDEEELALGPGCGWPESEES